MMRQVQCPVRCIPKAANNTAAHQIDCLPVFAKQIKKRKRLNKNRDKTENQITKFRDRQTNHPRHCSSG